MNALISLNTEAENLKLGNLTISISEIEKLINEAIRIVVILILMYIIIKLGNRVINKFVEKQMKSKARFSMDAQKAKTIGGVLKSSLKYITYFIGVALILSNFISGISIGLAGVGGVAVGLGFQSLVKDVINGFFILFEDQYGIGDHVTIGTYSGIIETIGIRTTVIRDFTGDIHLIPNGTIATVTNHSRGNMRFIVDVEIAYEEDIDNAMKVIEEVNKEFEGSHSDITEPIQIFGVTSLNAYSITIRIIGKSKPLKQWKMENELRKEIKIALEAANINIPYPKAEFINRNKGES